MRPLSVLNKNIHFVDFNKSSRLDLGLIWNIYKKMRELRPDVINTHSLGLFYSLLYIILHSKTKVYYTLHGLANKETSIYYRIIYGVLFKFFKVRPIAISNAVLKSIKYTYGDRFGNLIYNGVYEPDNITLDSSIAEEIRKYKQRESTTIFLHVARLAKEKNQRLLIQTFNCLVATNHDVVLLIIGDVKEGTFLNELKKIAGSWVYFLGKKDNVLNYFLYADAFCLTSNYEGFSLATVEAMSVKVIPICTPVGAIPEIVKDGFNGILSTDCTVEAYVTAMKRFLTMDGQTRAKLRENAFNTYKENFTFKKCGEAYLKLYSEA